MPLIRRNTLSQGCVLRAAVALCIERPIGPIAGNDQSCLCTRARDIARPTLSRVVKLARASMRPDPAVRSNRPTGALTAAPANSAAPLNPVRAQGAGWGGALSLRRIGNAQNERHGNSIAAGWGLNLELMK